MDYENDLMEQTTPEEPAETMEQPLFDEALEEADSQPEEEAPKERRGAYDIAVSRAVARLNVLCELCLPFVKAGGLFISMKAADCAAEVAEAANAIKTLGGAEPEIRTYGIPGTDVTRAAVLIRKVAETPDKYPRRWAKISKQPL